MGEEDEGFNPCECLWSHDMAMRRLLSVIRNSQSVCTDTECFETESTTPEDLLPPESFLFMTVLFVSALLLYFLRSRNPRVTDMSKPPQNNSNHGPPSPPPALD